MGDPDLLEYYGVKYQTGKIKAGRRKNYGNIYLPPSK